MQTQAEYARIIRRWTPTWPSRKAAYFDLTPWGGGYLRASGNPPGACRIKDDLLCDLRTGQVYRDSRFTSERI